MIDPNDPELMMGWDFGGQDIGKTPKDFLPGEDGIRPGAIAKNAPSGVSVTEINNGIEKYQVIPPIAVWKAGKWFDEFSESQQEAIQGNNLNPKIDPVDEREAWVVPGEGTPGNWILRVYIVPTKIAEHATPPHPSEWTKFQREKGDNLPVTTRWAGDSMYGIGYGGYGRTAASPPKPPEPPKPPPLPAGIKFRCVGCGHWYASDTKLSGHATHCCPGSSNWDAEYGADWVIECECCETLDEMCMVLEGFPRQKKEVEESTTADDSDPGTESKEQPSTGSGLTSGKKELVKA